MRIPVWVPSDRFHASCMLPSNGITYICTRVHVKLDHVLEREEKDGMETIQT